MDRSIYCSSHRMGIVFGFVDDDYLSHEKFPSWLDYIGDEILPRYNPGIIS